MLALFSRFSRYMAVGMTAAALATPAFALDTVKFMAPGSVGVAMTRPRGFWAKP